MDSANDYLARHNHALATYLESEVTHSDHYCSGTRCYEWQSCTESHRAAGEYETSLWQFLADDPGRGSKIVLDVLVIIGGIGTGKSTAVHEMIRRCTTEPRACSLART